jgi:hypothetical protein
LIILIILISVLLQNKIVTTETASARHWHCSLMGEYQHFRAIYCPSSVLKCVRWGLSWVIYCNVLCHWRRRSDW